MKVDKSIKFKKCQSLLEFVENIKYNMNIMWRDTLMIKEKKKVRATGTGCEWKIYASFVPDSKIFMVKTLNLILIPWQLLFFHISCTFYTWTLAHLRCCKFIGYY